MFAFVASLAIGGSCRGQLVDLPAVIHQVQPRIVKIFGAGGLNRLEHYQSGCFISDDGLILTVWSYVLDTEAIIVYANDGTRLEATLLGFDPQTEIALLKTTGGSYEPFEIAQSNVKVGSPILAFSNMYGVATGNEAVSVQRGIVSSVTGLGELMGAQVTSSSAMSYRGPCLLIDAITSNPGSAGGVITDNQGNFLGLIGKEQKSAASNMWVNYAIPALQVTEAITGIQSGQTRWVGDSTALPTEPMTLDLLGVVLIPKVVARTPPFIDRVVPGGPAELAGLQADDLVIEIAGFAIASRNDVLEVLKRVDRDDRLRIVVQREQELLTFEMTTKQ